jgi:DNA polymerase-4
MSKPRYILHIDMDAFYASVEQLDDPELKGKAVIVGGSPDKRGVVSAASYEARKFGVHSAMPMSKAVRLCPDGIVLPVRMKRYAELSGRIHEIFSRYTDQIEPISLDEAFLDVAGSIQLFGSAEQIGRRIKRQIKEELGLTASVGIAPNKFLAKLASDLEKPDGFVIITEGNKQRILDVLPISKIWGIGRVTAQALKAIGINTIAQLKNTAPEHLKDTLGNQTPGILRLAHGIDDREVESIHIAKSISSEETFAVDIKDKDVLLGVLLGQVQEVAQRLRKGKFEAKTITLKLRYGDFKTVTRSSTFDKATNTTETLWRQAQAVFLKWHKKSAGPLRLLGFGASGLITEGAGQKELFVNPQEEKQKRLDQASDKIKNRYGNDAVKRGR